MDVLLVFLNKICDNLQVLEKSNDSQEIVFIFFITRNNERFGVSPTEQNQSAAPCCPESCSSFLFELMPPGISKAYISRHRECIACFKAYTHIFLFDGSCQSSMDSPLYNYQCHPLYDARALCIGTRDGSPCERVARKYGRSQALLKLDTCSGSLSEHSYQMLAKCILCERCQQQTDQARRWLDTQASLLGKKETLYNNEEWVTARFNEVVRG